MLHPYRHFLYIASNYPQELNKLDIYNTLYQDQLMIRFIVPEVQQNGFRLQVPQSKYYKIMYPFKQGIIIFQKQDLTRKQIKLNPVTMLEILEILYLLEIQNLIVITLNCAELFDIKNEEIKQKLSKFKLKPPILTRIQEEDNLITFEKCLKLLKSMKYDIYLEQKQDILFYVTKLTHNIHQIEIKLIQGYLFVGQTFYINHHKMKIDEIIVHKQNVKSMVPPCIMEIKFSTNIKLNIPIVPGTICSFPQIQPLKQLSFEIQSSTSNQIEYLRGSKITYNLLDFDSYGIPQKNKQELFLDLTFENEKYCCQHSELNRMVTFHNLKGSIILFGKLITKPQQIQLNTGILIPREQFIHQLIPGKQIETKNIFYANCRLCKQAATNAVLIPCGHLRYCSGCAAEIKECYYCDQPKKKIAILKLIKINKINYKMLQSLKLNIWQITTSQYQSDVQHEQLQLQQIFIDEQTADVKCQVCFTEIIKCVHYCNIHDTIFLCKHCTFYCCKDGNNCLINYDFYND